MNLAPKKKMLTVAISVIACFSAFLVSQEWWKIKLIAAEIVFADDSLALTNFVQDEVFKLKSKDERCRLLLWLNLNRDHGNIHLSEAIDEFVENSGCKSQFIQAANSVLSTHNLTKEQRVGLESSLINLNIH